MAAKAGYCFSDQPARAVPDLRQHHGDLEAKLDPSAATRQKLSDAIQLKPGDTLDAQFYKGTIVLRKHQPLTPEQCAALLERSRTQPQPTPEDDAAVEQSIREVRAHRR